MSSAEVHSAKTAHGNAVNSASPEPRLPSPSSPPPRPPTTAGISPAPIFPSHGQIPAQVQSHYKNLLEVEEAFCELKSYLQIRPVFHRKPEGLINHPRICPSPTESAPASPTIGACVAKPAKSPRILRQLQTIRLAVVYIKNQGLQALKSITKIPADLNAQLGKLKLIILNSAVRN